MITDVEPSLPSTNPPTSPSAATMLPPGAEILHVAFVTQRAADQPLLLAFPPPIGRQAVLVRGDASVDVSLLSVPASPPSDLSNGSDNELLSKMKLWVDAVATSAGTASLMMTFQGAQLCWSPGRVAILAPPERLPALRAALIEVSFYEAELRDIERMLGETWPQLEADMPLAFEFEERSIGKRKALRQRFQQVLLMRARLARIGPYVHSPHLHPPTLASQIGERLRDRTRMAHRHEFVGEQIEVFERVYEMCGQRASDFMVARTGHMLEWIIIVLLLTQLLLGGVEYLTTFSSVATPVTVTGP